MILTITFETQSCVGSDNKHHFLISYLEYIHKFLIKLIVFFLGYLISKFRDVHVCSVILQPCNFQLSKSIVHEIKFGDIA